MKTGTGNSRARSSWKRIMNPQVVVSAFAPSRTSSRPAAMNGPSRDGSRSAMRRFRVAPATVRQSTGKGKWRGCRHHRGYARCGHPSPGFRSRARPPWHFVQAFLFLASAVLIDNRPLQEFLDSVRFALLWAIVVNTRVDRLKVNRLKADRLNEKTCAITQIQSTEACGRSRPASP